MSFESFDIWASISVSTGIVRTHKQRTRIGTNLFNLNLKCLLWVGTVHDDLWKLVFENEFFSWILISKMDVKMNLRMITKNHAANSKIGSPLKIDFRTDWTQESVPTACGLKFIVLTEISRLFIYHCGGLPLWILKISWIFDRVCSWGTLIYREKNSHFLGSLELFSQLFRVKLEKIVKFLFLITNFNNYYLLVYREFWATTYGLHRDHPLARWLNRIGIYLKSLRM